MTMRTISARVNIPDGYSFVDIRQVHPFESYLRPNHKVDVWRNTDVSNHTYIIVKKEPTWRPVQASDLSKVMEGKVIFARFNRGGGIESRLVGFTNDGIIQYLYFLHGEIKRSAFCMVQDE